MPSPAQPASRGVRPQGSAIVPGENIPLWIIAFSLATIALSLVFLVIGKKNEPVSRLATEADEASVVPEQAVRASHPSVVDHVIAARRANATPQVSIPARQDMSQPTENSVVPTVLATAPVQDHGSIIAASAVPVGFNAAAASFNTLVKGRIILKGRSPEEKPLPAGAPCASGSAPLMTHFFITDADGGLADALVTIEGIPSRWVTPAVDLELVFTNCQIEPFIGAALNINRVRARDASGLVHSLRYRGKDGLNVRPNSALVFNLPADLKPLTLISCDVHPWEMAYLSVVANPFFAVSDERGEFRIPNVPPGDYILRAQHKYPARLDETTQKITVKEGTVTRAELVLEAAAK